MSHYFIRNLYLQLINDHILFLLFLSMAKIGRLCGATDRLL